MRNKKSKKIKNNVLFMIFNENLEKQQRRTELKDKKTKSMVRAAKKNYVKGASVNPKFKVSKRQQRLADQENKVYA